MTTEPKTWAEVEDLLRQPALSGASLAALRHVGARAMEAVLPGVRSGFAFVGGAPRRLTFASAAPGAADPLPPDLVLLAPGDPAFAELDRGEPVLRRRPEPPAPPWGVLTGRGIGTVLFLPLRSAEGLLFGTWTLCAPEGASPSPEDLAWLRHLAGLLAPAAHRAFTEESAGDRAREQADSEKLAAVGRLVAGVAHELGGPLQAVISLAEVLIRDPAREDRLEAAHRILRSALRCRGMVQDLLAYARKQPHRLVAVRAEDALMDALELDRFSDVGEVQVHIEGPPRLPLVRADKQRLCQVFLNLITNARHATAASGRPGLVKVTLEAVDSDRARLPLPPGDRALRLSVTDQGPGVPVELHDRIFDPFFTTKPEGLGTGLGLSVSRSLVEEVGGILYLDPAHGSGARFVVELPVLAGDTAAEEVLLAESSAPRGGCSILLVDDDREVLETYEVILALDDHRVRSCDRARKALQMLREDRFDAILCDIRLPDISGRQFLEEVRALRPEMVPRIIFATGDVVNDETRAFLQGISNPALIKPFQVEDLQRAIAQVTRPDG